MYIYVYMERHHSLERPVKFIFDPYVNSEDPIIDL